MKHEDDAPWGARIERGRIARAETIGGEMRYDVESIDRPGVKGWGLPGMGFEVHANSSVYFFIFDDGDGRVLCEIAR